MSNASAPAIAERLQSLMAAGAGAMRAGDFVASEAFLGQAIALDPDEPQLWLSLAAARRAGGDPERALLAVDKALQLAPRDFKGLLMRASLIERVQGERAAGAAYGAALLQAPPDADLDAPTRRALEHGRDVNSRYGAALDAALRAGTDDLSLTGRAALNSSAFIDLLTGRRRPFRQEPLGYFYPGLPAIEFWDRAYFPWLADLEAATEAIRAEMLAVGFEDEALVPYIDFADHEPLDQWAALNRSDQWTAFHLFQHGRRIAPNCARCPAATAMLDRIPQPFAPNRSPSAMFSVLKPRTRIPPHTGVSNTRLVAHLALSIPPGCGFRVGNETREWRQGEAWVFDDTIEHAAWNDSDRPRAVLIFDVWNPLIPEDEREAIGRIMTAMDAFNAAPLQSG